MNMFLLVGFSFCLLTCFYVFFAKGEYGPVDNKISIIERSVWSVAILGIAIVLYIKVGDARAIQPEMTSSQLIEKNLEIARHNPASLENWNNLGRAYLLEQNYVHAYMAYTESEQLDQTDNQLNVDERLKWITGLAEARILAQQGGVDEISKDLIERALLLGPDHPKALWYGGLSAAQRNEFHIAQNLWKKLLAKNPPESLQKVVQARLDSLKTFLDVAVDQWTIKMDISLAQSLLNEQTADSRVFASLRQKENSPPLVARAYSLNELDQTVLLSSSDSISGMGQGNIPDIEWDDPVTLTLVWSPGGNALAANNIRISTAIEASDLDSVLAFKLGEDNK
jgi:tetratricopeptide (TPR) repeat protein